MPIPPVPLGSYNIGVERVGRSGNERRVFDGQIQVCELPADQHSLDVELKVNEARDRATTYNAARTE